MIVKWEVNPESGGLEKGRATAVGAHEAADGGSAVGEQASSQASKKKGGGGMAGKGKKVLLCTVWH